MNTSDAPMSNICDTVAHEATHVVDRLYNFIGVVNPIDTEINAYLIGWVSKCIMSVITNTTKK